MKKIKKIVVLVLACVMLFGMTLTASAACAHPSPTSCNILVSTTTVTTQLCGSAAGCYVTIKDLKYCDLRCAACGEYLRYKTVRTATHSVNH